jgi:hypothetical protein
MNLFKRKTEPSKQVNSRKASKLVVTSDSPEATELIINAATIGEIAELYQVSRPTIRKWIEPILKSLGRISGRTFTARQVERILRYLGIPGKRIRLTI